MVIQRRIRKTTRVVEEVDMACESPLLHGWRERVDRNGNAFVLQRGHDGIESRNLFGGVHGTCARIARRRTDVDGVCTVARELQRVGDRRVGVGMATAGGKRILGQVHHPEDSTRRQMMPSAASSSSSASPSPRRPLYTAPLSDPRIGAPRTTRPGVREKRG